MLIVRAPRTLTSAYIYAYDTLLTLYNLVAPKRKKGQVVRKDMPGAGRCWPEFVPPTEDDSRCACPMLNAMANHGILPHDGKDIKFTTLTETVRETWNFAPTFSLFVARFIADVLGRDYKTGACDLADISLHNGIEHDASITRQDCFFDSGQDKPYRPFIEQFLGSASGDNGLLLCDKDLARYLAQRRAHSRLANPEYSLDTLHRMLGTSNACSLTTMFAGNVSDLRCFLLEERFPLDWESHIRTRKGLTMATLNRTTIKVEAETLIEEARLRADLGSVGPSV
ncbi:unnamed protein product [Mycena citricolor]|uniref:Heme haloperoxidase family profile domain-containing protein n=1 Tax=Mycena citricolor TaxID=2018698 RepID=A0AAD2GQN2_9AGAR|nr:unnamed protein product [Mycena citricolor]CAK5262281.1 unnamed protein product [Mycena citricolor]CAK5274495.1 unnamed protein product [Mycena citricolor]